MSAAPARATGAHRLEKDDKRPKVNPIFLWTSQREQEIVEVRCEDYDKWNRIKLRKTAQGWRSIPRTASNTYATPVSSEANLEEPANALMSEFDAEGKDCPDMEDLRSRRNKYNDLIRSRKRKRSYKLSLERVSSEGRLNSNWKSKRRRKMKKYRRRKRITRSEEDMADEDEDDDETDEKMRHSENAIDAEKKGDQPLASNLCQKRFRIKFSDLEKMQTNKLLQPRVVLEQLHLSQLPKRVHSNLLDSIKQEDKDQEDSTARKDDEDEDGSQGQYEEHIDADDEGIEDEDEDDEEDERIKCDSKPTVMNKDDLQEILDNLLDYPSLNAADKTDHYEESPFGKPVKDDDPTRLDEPIEDPSSEKLSPIITSLSCFIDDSNEIIYGRKDKLSDAGEASLPKPCDDVATNDETKPSWESDDTGPIVSSVVSIGEEKQNTDNSKILQVLQNTPGISVTEYVAKESSRRSPDSQTEPSDEAVKCGPKVEPKSCITIPSYKKQWFESPESTVNCNGFNDVDDCDSQVLEDLQRQSRKHRSPKVVAKDIPQLRPLDERPLKPRNHHPESRKSNEAQAKLPNAFYLNDHVIDSLKSLGSVMSSNYVHSKKATNYLERLLPSPPCSVTCSEDVGRSDLTLRSILSSPKLVSEQKQQTKRFQEEVSEQPKSANHLPRIREDLHFPNGIFCNGDVFNYARSLPMYWPANSQVVKQAKTTHRPSASGGSRFQLDPASQLRKLLQTSGVIIPDPLLVPRDFLPILAASPSTGIPQLLTSRPDLRLPEALSNSELLKDPNLLVISLAHLQHVLDYGDKPYANMQQRSRVGEARVLEGEKNAQSKPVLSCKPIGSLMSSPMDLSSNRKANPCPPLLRVRSGLLKQESEVSSTANSPDDMNLWHPLFGR